MELKTCLITQARTGSSRLPGKVLKKVQGKELLYIHLQRLSQCKLVDKIIVATTIEPMDEKIASLVDDWGYSYFRGSEDDVLDRYYQALISSGCLPEWVVRVTSDCPLIDPLLVDEVIAFAKQSKVDYVSNSVVEHFPDGQDVEVFKFAALEKAWREAVLTSEREHVTPYIWNNSDIMGGQVFNALNFLCHKDYSKIRMTVDEERDFKLIEKLIVELGTEKTWLEYTQHIINNNLFTINSDIVRNEGYLKSLNND